MSVNYSQSASRYRPLLIDLTGQQEPAATPDDPEAIDEMSDDALEMIASILSDAKRAKQMVII